MKLTKLQQQALILVQTGHFVTFDNGQTFDWTGGEYPFDAKMSSGWDRDYQTQVKFLIKNDLARLKKIRPFNPKKQVVLWKNGASLERASA